jgi:hypothetical protein
VQLNTIRCLKNFPLSIVWDDIFVKPTVDKRHLPT